MSVILNHAVSFLTSPLFVAMALFAAGFFGSVFGRGRAGRALLVVGLLWLYVMSSGWMMLALGLGLERNFPPTPVEQLPNADAVVVLGGGYDGNTNAARYVDLKNAADRVTHAARIWKAGKAPVLIVSGTNSVELAGKMFLELGVPRLALRFENDSCNTEENARFVAAFVKSRQNKASANSTLQLQLPTTTKPRVLLVTSAWHMPRALLLFEKYADEIEVVPAACDHEATLAAANFDIVDCVVPTADFLWHNSLYLKEYIGYWGYKLFR